MVKEKAIPENRIIAQGYGETQLSNDCGNRSNCTEEQHAENRRTELKILSVVGQGQIRTLRQLKADELFDEILEEISEQEQVVVPQDVDVNEFLAAQNNSVAKNKPRASIKYSDTPVEEVAQGEIVISEDEHRVETEVVVAQDHTESNQDESGILMTENESADPARYSPNYTGYKIVIHFSRFALSKEHPLFQKFPELDVYTTADGNRLYMVESFSTKKKAELRMNKKYASSFPNAYIMGFENGIITD